MAERKVTPSATSAADGSLVGELVAIVNSLSTKINALTAKLDLDAGVTDVNYASTIGTADTLSYRGINTPS